MDTGRRWGPGRERVYHLPHRRSRRAGRGIGPPEFLGAAPRLALDAPGNLGKDTNPPLARHTPRENPEMTNRKRLVTSAGFLGVVVGNEIQECDHLQHLVRMVDRGQHSCQNVLGFEGVCGRSCMARFFNTRLQRPSFRQPRCLRRSGRIPYVAQDLQAVSTGTMNDRNAIVVDENELSFSQTVCGKAHRKGDRHAPDDQSTFGRYLDG